MLRYIAAEAPSPPPQAAVVCHRWFVGWIQALRQKEAAAKATSTDDDAHESCDQTITTDTGVVYYVRIVSWQRNQYHVRKLLSPVSTAKFLPLIFFAFPLLLSPCCCAYCIVQSTKKEDICEANSASRAQKDLNWPSPASITMQQQRAPPSLSLFLFYTIAKQFWQILSSPRRQLRDFLVLSRFLATSTTYPIVWAWPRREKN